MIQESSNKNNAKLKFAEKLKIFIKYVKQSRENRMTPMMMISLIGIEKKIRVNRSKAGSIIYLDSDYK